MNHRVAEPAPHGMRIAHILMLFGLLPPMAMHIALWFVPSRFGFALPSSVTLCDGLSFSVEALGLARLDVKLKP